MRRENISCWKTICNAKSLYRFAAIVQCVLIQAFVLAFLAFFWLFPREVSQYFPKLVKNLLFPLENPSVAFWAGLYGLCACEMAFWPFFIVAFSGTKAKSWLVCCLVANVFIEVHFLAFWLINLICEHSYNLAFFVSSALLFVEAVILALNGLILRVRIKEGLALHRATLVSRV